MFELPFRVLVATADADVADAGPPQDACLNRNCQQKFITSSGIRQEIVNTTLLLRLADGLAEQTLGRRAGDAGIEQRLELIQYRPGLFRPQGGDLLRLELLLFGLALHVVELADQVQGGMGRTTLALLAGSLLDFDEFTPDMGHAAEVAQTFPFAQSLVAAVAVGLEIDFEIAKDFRSHAAGPGRMITKQDDRLSRCSAPGNPHEGFRGVGPARFGKHLDRGFIHVGDCCVILVGAVRSSLSRSLRRQLRLIFLPI